MTSERRRLRVTDLDDEGSFQDVDADAAAAPGASAEPVARLDDPAADDRSPTRPRHSAIVRPLPGGQRPEERGVARVEVVVDGWRFRFQVESSQRARLRDRARRAAADHGPATPQTIRAQLPGRVVSVAVTDGEQVTIGQRLLAIEAMKMENEVRAPRTGTVAAVSVSAGDRVELGDELVRIV